MFVFIRSCLQLDVSVNVPLQCSPIPNRLTPQIAYSNHKKSHGGYNCRIYTFQILSCSNRLLMAC